MNIFKKAVCAIAAVCMAQAAFSIPADPKPKQVKMADGTMVSAIVCGDENGHAYFTADGKLLVYNEATGCFSYASPDEEQEMKDKWTSEEAGAYSICPELASKPKRLLIKNFPTIGSPRSLVLLVEFSDVQFTSVGNPKDFYTRMLNEEGFTHSNGAEGSVLDFYKASSMGQFTPQFDVVGPIKLPNTRKYYGGDSPLQDNNVAEVIVEACKMADSEVDFSMYDTDGDGVVDNVYYFYAGGGQADNTTLKEAIWPHSSNLTSPIMLDGKQIVSYACSNELRYTEDGSLATAGIGTFVHEFGHVLGLVDHYDSFYSGFVFHPGSWDTMATGSYNNNGNTPPLFTAFERSELGWLALTELEVGTDSVSRLPELTQSNFAYRISVPGKPSEYYVLENRQQQGWDRFLPGHGMLMWHIDVDTAEWKGNTANTIGNHQLIDIVEADDIISENSRNADVFPGENNIRAWSIRAWNDTELMYLEEIDETNGMIKFVQKGTAYKMPQPEKISISNVEDSCFTLTWSEVNDATYYILSINKLESDGSKTPVANYSEKRFDCVPVLTVNLLQPQSAYEVSVIAGIGSYFSQAITTNVQTTAIPFDKLKVDAITLNNVKDKSFTASWSAVEGADAYQVELVAHGLSSTTTGMGYDFTNKSEGMPNLWIQSGGTYYSVSGNYGQAAPSLRMNADGDQLTIKYAEAKIATLSFWLRSSKGTGEVVVEKLVDEAWTEATRFTPSTTASTITLELAGADAARITYIRESGYICIDDISVECHTLQRIPVEGYIGLNIGNVTSCDFNNLQPTTTYGLFVTALSDSKTSLKSAECIVTTLSESAGINDLQNTNITDGGPTYDLYGRKVQSPSKGLYIRNGKIFIVR